MAFPLDEASHVHEDVPGGGVTFDAVPEPTIGRGRDYAKLQQMEDGNTHRGGDVAPYVLAVNKVLLRDINISHAPCLFDRGGGNVGKFDETQPGPEDEEVCCGLLVGLLNRIPIQWQEYEMSPCSRLLWW